MCSRIVAPALAPETAAGATARAGGTASARGCDGWVGALPVSATATSGMATCGIAIASRHGCFGPSAVPAACAGGTSTGLCWIGAERIRSQPAEIGASGGRLSRKLAWRCGSICVTSARGLDACASAARSAADHTRQRAAADLAAGSSSALIGMVPSPLPPASMAAQASGSCSPRPLLTGSLAPAGSVDGLLPTIPPCAPRICIDLGAARRGVVLQILAARSAAACFSR